MITDIIINVNLKFQCRDHKNSVIVNFLHYYIPIRMRQYEREHNRSSKNRNQETKKKGIQTVCYLNGKLYNFLLCR